MRDVSCFISFGTSLRSVMCTFYMWKGRLEEVAQIIIDVNSITDFTNNRKSHCIPINFEHLCLKKVCNFLCVWNLSFSSNTWKDDVLSLYITLPHLSFFTPSNQYRLLISTIKMFRIWTTDLVFIQLMSL